MNHPKTIRGTANWLRKTLMRPPMPECPSECERDCGVPQGKAPAYLNGRAHLISWKTYQERMPTSEELELWFQKSPGIGTLGGWNGQHYIGFIDLDHKAETFDSYEAFQSLYELWLESYPVLKTAPRFKTPSGGYRVILAFAQKPDWTAFTLIEGGQRMGELLARNGAHTLLPPTVGTNGKAYEWEYFVEYPPAVETPGDVGIYPTRKNHGAGGGDRTIQRTNYLPGAIRLEDLGCSFSQEVLLGCDPEGDRSLSLSKAIHEWYGWENFCNRYGIAYSGSTADLAAYAWSKMEQSGRDGDKWERILKTIDPSTSKTSSEHASSDETGCWLRVRKLDRAVFNEKCPDHIKQTLKTERQAVTQSKPATGVKTFQEVRDRTSPSIDSQDDYKDFRTEVAGVLALADPLEQKFKLRRIASKWSVPFDFVQTAIDTLSERKAERKTCFTLKDLMELPDEALSWAIPRFLPKAELVLLSAKAKTGKSLLAYEAAYAVITGSEFMGEKVKPGKVLIIQTEEGIAFSIKRRLERRGFLDEAIASQDRLRVETFFDVNDFSGLEKQLEDFRPDLVIVDSLRKISRNSNISENAAEFAKPVYKLAELLRDYGAAGILIHHDNKTQDAQGIDAIAGTSALVGACWGSWRLLRVSTDENNTNRHLSVVPRDGSGSRYHLEYVEGDGGAWSWQFHQELNIDPDMREKEQRIIEVLRLNQDSSPNGMTLHDLRYVMSLPAGDRSLYRPLNRLVEKQLISCQRDSRDRRISRYSLPEFQTTPPSLEVLNTESTNSSETYTEQGLKSSQESSHNRNQSFTPPVTDTNGDEFENDSNQARERDLVLLPNSSHRNSPEEGGGTKLACSERNGVVEYRRDAKPRGKFLSGMVGADQLEVTAENGHFKLGDMVMCDRLPGQILQVERINSGLVRFSMAQGEFPVESLSMVEADGFELGESIRVSVDHFDERTQKEIVKFKEAPVGAIGTIERFAVNTLSLQYDDVMILAFLKIEGYEELQRVPTDYLRTLEAQS